MERAQAFCAGFETAAVKYIDKKNAAVWGNLYGDFYFRGIKPGGRACCPFDVSVFRAQCLTCRTQRVTGEEPAEDRTEKLSLAAFLHTKA